MNRPTTHNPAFVQWYKDRDFPEVKSGNDSIIISSDRPHEVTQCITYHNELLDRLKEAEEVIEFYASEKNYDGDNFSLTSGNKCKDVVLFDFDREYDMGVDVAGRRAREYQKKARMK